MKKTTTFIIILSFVLSACTQMAIQNVEFAWPIESVLKSDESGFVKDKRYALAFNIKDLMMAETKSAANYNNKEIRIIRNINGYYFVTAAKFKNVYVFKAEEGKLLAENILNIGDKSLINPVFNQRSPYVELIDGNNRYHLTKDNITRK